MPTYIQKDKACMHLISLYLCLFSLHMPRIGTPWRRGRCVRELPLGTSWFPVPGTATREVLRLMGSRVEGLGLGFDIHPALPIIRNIPSLP